MKQKTLLKRRSSFLLALTLSFVTLSGQSNVQERSDSLRKIDYIHYSFELESMVYMFENGDLTNTDPRSYLTVDRTDDKLVSAFTYASLALEARLYMQFTLVAELAFLDVWGSSYQDVWLEGIRLDWNTKDLTGRYYDLGISVGSIETSLSPTSLNQFLLDRRMDALIFSLQPADKRGLKLDVLWDFFSMNASSEKVYFNTIADSEKDQVVGGFEGDVNTYQLGLLPGLAVGGENWQSHLNILALFTRIAATSAGNYTEGGAEKSDLGDSGNFIDGDYLLNLGVLWDLEWRALSGIAEMAYSHGRDRKQVDIPEVNIKGFMAHVGGRLIFSGGRFNPYGEFEAIYSSGSKTDDYGHYLNYGYVGQKGERAGGFLFSDYYGNYPFAVVEYSGIDFEPFTRSRRAASTILSLRAGLKSLGLLKPEERKGGFDLELSGHYYIDNNSSSLDPDLSLPAHRYNQYRLGRLMGYEVNADLAYVQVDRFEIGSRVGVFVPESFYFQASTLEESPYGTSLFWGFQIYTTLEY